jgi:hydrogenase small subunit
MIPLDDVGRLNGCLRTVHDGCDRALRAGHFAHEYGSPKCIVKLGCWGPW